MYLQTEVYWQSTGRLRRRWFSPNETIHGYEEYANGRFNDFVSPITELTDEMRLWNIGEWTLDGEVMVVEWLDDQATAAFRMERGYPPPLY